MTMNSRVTRIAAAALSAGWLLFSFSACSRGAKKEGEGQS